MDSSAVIVITVVGMNGDTHVLRVAPTLWKRNSSGVMQKLYEAIDGIAGFPLRYGGGPWPLVPPAGGERAIGPDI